MPNIGTWLQLLKYAPMVIGAVKQMRGGGQSEETQQEIVETRNAFDDFKKTINQRLEAAENENARLKTRIREMESSLTIFKVLLWTSGGIAIVGFVLALLAFIIR